MLAGVRSAHGPGGVERGAEPTGRGFSSAMTECRSARGVGSWRAAWGLSGVPGAEVVERLTAAGAKRDGSRRGQRFGRLEVGLGRLPGGALGVGEHGGLLEQGPDAVEFEAGGGMEPAEAADAMKALGQDVLEETADEFEGLQVEELLLAGGAVTVTPPHAAIGQHGQFAIAGGGLEDVAAEVTQRVLAGTDRLAVNDPALLPEASGQARHQVGRGALQGAAKEGAVVIGQGMDVDEELSAAGDPVALIETQTAGGNQIVDVRVVDQRPAPGVEDAEHAQRGAEPVGVAGQVVEGLGRGGEEEVEAHLRVRAHPGAQGFRDGEGDQEVGDGEQEAGVVGQPLVGVGLTALGTVAVVAGVVGEMEGAAGWAGEEFAAQGGGATGQELGQHLAQPPGQGGAEAFPVSRPPLAEQLVEMDRATAGPCRTGHGHEPGSEVGHEGIQALLMLGATEGGQVGVDDGGGGTSVTEVDLELPEVLALLEQMGGIAVAQAMDVGGLLDAGGYPGEAEGALKGGATHRQGGGGRPLAVVAFGGEEETGMAMGFPGLPEQEQGALGQWDVAVPVAFGGADVEEHAPGVDVADFQVEGLAEPEAAGVDGGEGDAVIEGGNGGENLAHLGGGEDDGELELGGGTDQFDFGGPGAAEALLPKEFEGADGLGGTGAGEAAFGLEVEEVLAEFLGGGLLGGLVEMLGELADAGEVGLLGAGEDREQAQVLGEAD